MHPRFIALVATSTLAAFFVTFGLVLMSINSVEPATVCYNQDSVAETHEPLCIEQPLCVYRCMGMILLMCAWFIVWPLVVVAGYHYMPPYTKLPQPTDYTSQTDL